MSCRCAADLLHILGAAPADGRQHFLEQLDAVGRREEVFLQLRRALAGRQVVAWQRRNVARLPSSWRLMHESYAVSA